MKKLFAVLSLSLIGAFCLSGCGVPKVSASLDKNDVKLPDCPNENEFTKVITYESFSKAVVYEKINKALSNAKYNIYFIGNGVEVDSIAIASVDKKGERIGACKTKIKAIGNPMFGMNGDQMTYIRGRTSYTSMSVSIYEYDPISNSTKKGNFSAKYHMDIPASDVKGVGSFFGDVAAENPNIVNPYFFIDTLKENGVISDNKTTIKTKKVDNITYYLVQFSSDFLTPLCVSENTFIIAMYNKSIYGMKLRTKYYLENDPETYLYSGVALMPFTGTLKDVPTSFGGYEMTMEEYFKALQDRIVEILK